MSDTQTSLFDTQYSSEYISDNVCKHQSKKILWTLNIDGASRGNPGPSGVGVSIKKEGKVVSGHGCFIGKKTNNEAEYYALLLGLFLIKNEVGFDDRVHVISDSQLLIKQMLGVYRVRKPELVQLYTFAQHECGSLQITFEHVLREHNYAADALANDGIDKKRALPLKFLDMLQRHEIYI